jgi:hypothetical protein
MPHAPWMPRPVIFFWTSYLIGQRAPAIDRPLAVCRLPYHLAYHLTLRLGCQPHLRLMSLRLMSLLLLLLF